LEHPGLPEASHRRQRLKVQALVATRWRQIAASIFLPVKQVHWLSCPTQNIHGVRLRGKGGGRREHLDMGRWGL
jgi:hypothetical protein